MYAVKWTILPHAQQLGNEEGVFSLDPETGVLSTAASLDREERASYVLTIRAMDSAGIHSLSSITEVLQISAHMTAQFM